MATSPSAWYFDWLVRHRYALPGAQRVVQNPLHPLPLAAAAPDDAAAGTLPPARVFAFFGRLEVRRPRWPGLHAGLIPCVCLAAQVLKGLHVFLAALDQVMAAEGGPRPTQVFFVGLTAPYFLPGVRCS